MSKFSGDNYFYSFALKFSTCLQLPSNGRSRFSLSPKSKGIIIQILGTSIFLDKTKLRKFSENYHPIPPLHHLCFSFALVALLQPELFAFSLRPNPYPLEVVLLSFSQAETLPPLDLCAIVSTARLDYFHTRIAASAHPCLAGAFPFLSFLFLMYRDTLSPHGVRTIFEDHSVHSVSAL